MLSPAAAIRRAAPADAAGIAEVHVAAWRSAYAGLLPADYLARMSVRRSAAQMRAGIDSGHAVLVAEAEGHVVGYATVGRPRTPGLADGEVETLYVLDDWREQGLGRQLLLEAAGLLDASGCGSLFLWVLEGNPSRWFYERLGGRPVRRSSMTLAGQRLSQMAYRWEPIELLTRARS